MTKRTVHRFTKDEDYVIISETKKHNGNVKDAVQDIINVIGEMHSRRAIIERYRYFLSQNTKDWTKEEDNYILNSVKNVGTKWAKIAKTLNNRSGDQVKIRFRQLVRINEEIARNSENLDFIDS